MNTRDGFLLFPIPSNPGNGGAVFMVEENVLTMSREYAAAVRKTMDVRGGILYGFHVWGAKKDSDMIPLSWQIGSLATI
ncbi:hypothetical protein [uncultured Oscillibacter sp.]|uniref:hypothetical protein n=1 Tax=uncultured Oscillibacter sp. TaxID=876091 RepID=UPI002670ACB6|nr:hypothetical protein [uncultured Oscillibacter sp.]